MFARLGNRSSTTSVSNVSSKPVYEMNRKYYPNYFNIDLDTTLPSNDKHESFVVVNTNGHKKVIPSFFNMYKELQNTEDRLLEASMNDVGSIIMPHAVPIGGDENEQSRIETTMERMGNQPILPTVLSKGMSYVRGENGSTDVQLPDAMTMESANVISRDSDDNDTNSGKPEGGAKKWHFFLTSGYLNLIIICIVSVTAMIVFPFILKIILDYRIQVLKLRI
jgi:hypothetical protein